MKVLSDDQLKELGLDLFVESVEDVLGLYYIEQQVREILVCDDNDAREQSLLVVNLLLEKGMQAGVSPYLGGFEPWPNQDRTSVIQRIRSEWISSGTKPDFSGSAWFGPPNKKVAPDLN